MYEKGVLVFGMCFIFGAWCSAGAADFKTKRVNGQITLTGYKGSVIDLHIPDKNNGATTLAKP
jgi:hypothetical protein